MGASAGVGTLVPSERPGAASVDSRQRSARIDLGGIDTGRVPMRACGMRQGRESAFARVLLAVSATILVACGGAESASPSGAAPGEARSAVPSVSLPAVVAADPAEVAAAAAAISAADFARPETIDAVEAVALTDAGVQAAADAIGHGAKGDALWAATWIYANGGIDPTPLLPLLTADDASARAMAAAALLARGVKEGAEPLVALAGSDEPLRGSKPPVIVGDFAAGSLARFIDGPNVASGASRADAAATWSAWLTQNGSAMAYDPASARWSAP
jgi:hypothetical protein